MEEPEIEQQEAIYVREFWDLHTERRGESMPIPASVIRDRASELGFEDDLERLFVDVMREMDEGYRQWKAEEFEKWKRYNAPSKKAGSTERKRRR